MNLRNALLGLALAPLLAAAAAQAQPAQPTVINVSLVDYQFEPKVIELNQGQAYILHLTNPSNKKHGFESKTFFATVTYADWSKDRVQDGVVEVWPGQWNDIALTPDAPGTYELHSPDSMNELLGMKGEIVVH